MITSYINSYNNSSDSNSTEKCPVLKPYDLSNIFE